MKKMILFFSLAAILVLVINLQTTVDAETRFSSCVNAAGVICLPSYLDPGWSHLGTWVVTSQTPKPDAAAEMTAPSAGIHNIYTQSSTLKKYEQTGRFPDGAILVMEVRTLEWDDLPTGHVIYGGEAVKCFVMVKDQKQRFKGNPNWGNGWGWALFRSNEPAKNISTNYKKDCLDCHQLAEETDLVFTGALAALKK